MDKKKRILKYILSSSTGIIVMSLIIIIPILMLLDFFGANITDNYVENNADYAEEYLKVVRKNVLAGNGYVSLDRILYFYLENEQLTFDQIYTDNLDSELKQVKPISEVCKMNRYKIYSVCDIEEIEASSQIDEVQNKPFVLPLELSKMNITSFFMQERIIYGEYRVHRAWDIASPNQTPVYAVCDGVVDEISFPYVDNVIDKSGGAGNYITLKCEVDELTYKVLYGHLYPKSSMLKKGNKVIAGQVIATVGTTGYSTGSHLHFQVTRDDVYVDGFSLIDFTYKNDKLQIKPIKPSYGLEYGN